MKHTIVQNKALCFGGRAPLFSQRDLFRLVGPLLVEQLLAVTVGMADTMMVSRCGEAAISGVSLVDMINNLIIVLFAALATGGAVVVSQYLGAKEQKHANASSLVCSTCASRRSATRSWQCTMPVLRSSAAWATPKSPCRSAS